MILQTMVGSKNLSTSRPVLCVFVCLARLGHPRLMTDSLCRSGHHSRHLIIESMFVAINSSVTTKLATLFIETVSGIRHQSVSV